MLSSRARLAPVTTVRPSVGGFFLAYAWQRGNFRPARTVTDICNASFPILKSSAVRARRFSADVFRSSSRRTAGVRPPLRKAARCALRASPPCATLPPDSATADSRPPIRAIRAIREGNRWRDPLPRALPFGPRFADTIPKRKHSGKRCSPIATAPPCARRPPTSGNANRSSRYGYIQMATDK